MTLIVILEYQWILLKYIGDVSDVKWILMATAGLQPWRTWSVLWGATKGTADTIDGNGKSMKYKIHIYKYTYIYIIYIYHYIIYIYNII